MIRGEIEYYNILAMVLRDFPGELAKTRFRGRIDLRPLLVDVQDVSPVRTGRLRASFRPAPNRIAVQSRLYYAPFQATRTEERLTRSRLVRRRVRPPLVQFAYRRNQMPNVQNLVAANSTLITKLFPPLTVPVGGVPLTSPIL